MRPAVVVGLLLWGGTILLLSEVRWFARRALVDRLAPYALRPSPDASRAGLLSFESFFDVIGPMSRGVGERLSRMFGVSEELSVRLTRIHAPYDVTTFRIRQLGLSVAALLFSAVVDLALGPPLLVGLLVLVGAPLLAFLLVEQRMAARSAAWQRRVFLELPVVSEQMAMLLTSGFSLGAALNRLAHRGRGACAEDLGRVVGRIRQGLTEPEALREWAAVVRVDALDRLVPVLALNSEAADLGRLISEEARSIRRDVQRELVETMERRSQAVWVPVTVATLIPGVILLAIPFTQALKLFSGG